MKLNIFKKNTHSCFRKSGESWCVPIWLTILCIDETVNHKVYFKDCEQHYTLLKTTTNRNIKFFLCLPF